MPDFRKCVFGLALSFCLCLYPVCVQGKMSSVADLKAQALEASLQGDDDRAGELFAQAIALAKREYGANAGEVGDLFFDMGSFALQSAKFQMAEDALRQALAINPNSIGTRLKLADVLRLRGNFEESKRLSQSVLSAGDLLDGHKSLARIFAEEGNPARAIKEFALIDGIRRQGTQLKPAFRPLAPALPHKAGKEAKAPQANTAHPQTHPEEKANPVKAKENAREKKHSKVKAKEQKAKLKPEAQPKPAFAAQNKSRNKAQSKTKNKPEGKKHKLIMEQAREEPVQGTGKRSNGEKAGKPLELKANARPLRAKGKGGGHGLVPPPPPVVPMFGEVAPPPPSAQLPEPRAKAKFVEHKEAKESKPALPSANENPDFLLDWAGKKKN